MSPDEALIHQAIALAMNGRGQVEPNPMVGCIISNNGQIIGRGIHARFGQPHAEPSALASCTDSPRGATAYVTLEPCCHTNKQTPPCAPRLIEAGLSRVVIGCLDPNPDVNGKGIAMLQQAGIQVMTGVLESQAKQLIAPFIARTLFNRPYITLKWAQTADAKVAGPQGVRLQISNARATKVVHQLRGRCDAIMVGINTVLMDDPMLTARGIPGARPLLRIILDHQLRTPLGSKLVQSAMRSPVMIFCAPDAPNSSAFRAQGVLIEPMLPLPQLLQKLAALRITHLLVEPGPTLAQSFLNQNLADRIWVIKSGKVLNDPTAPQAPRLHLPIAGQLYLDDNILTEYLNPRSDVFFSATPSADLTLSAANT